jgi:hypothetical protein
MLNSTQSKLWSRQMLPSGCHISFIYSTHTQIYPLSHPPKPSFSIMKWMPFICHSLSRSINRKQSVPNVVEKVDTQIIIEYYKTVAIQSFWSRVDEDLWGETAKASGIRKKSSAFQCVKVEVSKHCLHSSIWFLRDRTAFLCSLPPLHYISHVYLSSGSCTSGRPSVMPPSNSAWCSHYQSSIMQGLCLFYLWFPGG